MTDPFGASLCLLLVGIFFARPLYRMNILTFGDFYRVKFGKRAELIASLFLVPSYFGWIAAQFVAIGILLNVVAGVPFPLGLFAGAAVVILYTYIGGMWAVSVTDFLQTIMILVGIGFVSYQVYQLSGGFENVVNKAPEGFFNFFPKTDFNSWAHYVAAWITIGLGSIPQQDVFQRVMAARSEKVAIRASYIGAGMYLTVGFVPLFIALVTKQVYPELLNGDAQLTIPRLVLSQTSPFLQVLFFGALLSAIMSTSSGAILAPASILAENILRPRMKNLDDRKLLRLLRLSVVAVAAVSLILANIQGNIHDLVAMSSVFSLVSLFAPMLAGLYWKWIKPNGAIASMFAGITVWLICEIMEWNSIPTLLPGLLASFVGLFIGNWIPATSKPSNEQEKLVGKEF